MVYLLTGAHWTMPFYLSDIFCQTARGVRVSVRLSVCLPSFLSVYPCIASLFVCPLLLPMSVSLCGMCRLVHVQSLGEL